VLILSKPLYQRELLIKTIAAVPFKNNCQKQTE